MNVQVDIRKTYTARGRLRGFRAAAGRLGEGRELVAEGPTEARARAALYELALEIASRPAMKVFYETLTGGWNLIEVTTEGEYSCCRSWSASGTRLGSCASDELGAWRYAAHLVGTYGTGKWTTDSVSSMWAMKSAIKGHRTESACCAERLTDAEVTR